jgi:hypothetical protein
MRLVLAGDLSLIVMLFDTMVSSRRGICSLYKTNIGRSPGSSLLLLCTIPQRIHDIMTLFEAEDGRMAIHRECEAFMI